MTAEFRPSRILLTGASGFVGTHLGIALDAAGVDVRRATRSSDRASQRGWVRVDLDEPVTLPPAMEGCDAAVYLVHGMAAGARGYEEAEARAAAAFRDAAAAAGVGRIVYLGGVAPAGAPSRHLRSRLATGELLRSGPVPAVELRAAMIIGLGSASWQVVRDLAARLPGMILPKWLRNLSSPVFVEDVVEALLAALVLGTDRAGWYDLPGERTISHRDLLRMVASWFGHRPIMIDVPVLSPRLSSYWIGLVTSADLGLAAELVEGLITDLVPTGASFWDLMPGVRPTPLEDAVNLALEDERAVRRPSARMTERLAEIGRAWAER